MLLVNIYLCVIG